MRIPKRKNRFISCTLLCTAILFLLSACSGAKDLAEKQIMEHSGILADEDYIQYAELREAEQLNEEGIYLPASELNAESPPSAPEGIHVTFAENSYLDISYFYDAELSAPVDTAACYLEPGGCVYAGEPECVTPFGDLYHFEEFRFYEYDQDSRRGKELSWDTSGENVVLQIPENYSGTEISVEPYGKYSKSKISLQDYYIDNNGHTQGANGSWFVNGEELKSSQMEVTPAASYTVDYAYDTDKYEFVGSEPRSFSHENGLVQFETARADEPVESYSVQLQPLGREVPLKIALKESAKDIYFSVSASGKQTDLRYSGGDKTSIRPDWLGGTDRLVFDEKIRMGSDITIEAESGTLLDGYALRLDIVRTDTDGREHTEIAYISKLPEKHLLSVYEGVSTVVYEEITVTVSKVEVSTYSPVSAANETVELRFTDTDGETALKTKDILEDSRMVEVTIRPDAGFYITGSDVSNDVYQKTMKYSKWVSDAEKILKKHPAKIIRSVTLDTADDYGDCVYKLDGKEVSGKVPVREEQKLVLEYTITDTNYQIAGGLFKSKTDKKQEISIAELTDGATLRRSDYIKVEKKG